MSCVVRVCERGKTYAVIARLQSFSPDRPRVCWWRVFEVVGRLTSSRTSVLVLAHTNGRQRSFQPVARA